jgi:tetratricopeptide (TPR) repeat protein
MRVLLLLMIGVALLGQARLAGAQTPEARARELNRRGMSKYELGDLPEALSLFKRAYEIHPEPRILFNIAQTHRKGRDYALALDAYRAYLRNMPDAPNRALVEERLGELEELLAAQKASDEKPPDGVTPAPEPATEPLAPEPMPPSTVGTRDDRWYRDVLGWSLVGGGVLLAATGTVFYMQAQSRKSDLDSAPESERDPLRTQVRRDQTLGGVGVAVGAAVLSAGVVRLLLVKGRSSRGRDVGVSLHPSGLFIAGRF